MHINKAYNNLIITYDIAERHCKWYWPWETISMQGSCWHWLLKHILRTLPGPGRHVGQGS